VGRIVVDNGVDYFPCRDLLFDLVEEANELLVATTLHVATDDGAVDDVEGREQRGGALKFVIVGQRAGGNPTLPIARRSAADIRIVIAHRFVERTRAVTVSPPFELPLIPTTHPSSIRTSSTVKSSRISHIQVVRVRPVKIAKRVSRQKFASFQQQRPPKLFAFWW
jgi:hypothetical protein